jgi:hypothetical protein
MEPGRTPTARSIGIEATTLKDDEMKYIGGILLILVALAVMAGFSRAASSGAYKNNPVMGALIGAIPIVLLVWAIRVMFF